MLFTVIMDLHYFLLSLMLGWDAFHHGQMRLKSKHLLSLAKKLISSTIDK